MHTRCLISVTCDRVLETRGPAEVAGRKAWGTSLEVREARTGVS